MRRFPLVQRGRRVALAHPAQNSEGTGGRGHHGVEAADRTKYGTRQEYLDALSAVCDSGMQSYADIVFNHRLVGGAAGSEDWVN